MSEPVRLSKRLIELIHCSRSEAEKYIEGGWVLVDGEIVDAPQFKVLDQKVELHPDATLAPIEPATILLNMPEKFDVTAPNAALSLIIPAARSADDRSGVRLLRRHLAGLMPTTPLETGAKGLLVFTQDDRVLRRLVQDAQKNEQEYIVEVSGEIVADGLARLNSGMQRNGRPLPPAKVSWQNEKRLRFALKSIEPGQIEFMCAQVGLTVQAMTRIRIGRVPMAKLPPGQWCFLSAGVLF